MASEFRRREIAHDDVGLSYLDNDVDGPVIVALHGLAGTGDEFIATATTVGGSYRFVLPDSRGHGHSTRRPTDVSRAAFVDDVATVIRRVSPGRPVTLVGQSMGGHTAILAAASFPDLVARLIVLEATVAVGVSAAGLEQPQMMVLAPAGELAQIQLIRLTGQAAVPGQESS